IDTLDYSASAVGGAVNLAAGFTSIGFGVVTDTFTSIENVTGSVFCDPITGHGKRNTLLGVGGRDTPVRRARRDTLNGGAGHDTLTGGGGADTFVFVRGEADGDFVTDFGGGDKLSFVGYGSEADGASLTRVDNWHWSINSADGAAHDIIRVENP